MYNNVCTHNQLLGGGIFMGLFDAFKKKKNDNKKLSSYEENALRLGGVHAIIAIKWGEEGTKQAVAECKDIINTIISEMDVHRKTELLEYGLDFCEELLTRNQQKHPELTLGRNCITAFIYYRFQRFFRILGILTIKFYF